jgi:hypothetical protein
MFTPTRDRLSTKERVLAYYDQGDYDTLRADRIRMGNWQRASSACTGPCCVFRVNGKRYVTPGVLRKAYGGT